MKFDTAQFLLLQNFRTEKREREVERWGSGRERGRRRDKAAGDRGEGLKHGWGWYNYIPRSSTRTPGHEKGGGEREIKINSWHLEKLIGGKNRRVYIKRSKTSTAEKFRNGSESGCDGVSSGEILCLDHGNCCDCGWRSDCGSCSGCHGCESVIFRNLGCGDRLISHECKQSLPGGHKRTWHWKGIHSCLRWKCHRWNKGLAVVLDTSRFLTYSPQHSKAKNNYPWC